MYSGNQHIDPDCRTSTPRCNTTLGTYGDLTSGEILDQFFWGPASSRDTFNASSMGVGTSTPVKPFCTTPKRNVTFDPTLDKSNTLNVQSTRYLPTSVFSTGFGQSGPFGTTTTVTNSYTCMPKPSISAYYSGLSD